MRDGEQRDRILGGAANRAKVDAYIAALVAEAPPLTAPQKAQLRVLLRPRTNPPNALPALAPSTQQAA